MLSETVSLPPQPFKHPRWMATPNVTWHQLPECQESEWQFFCSDVGLHQNRDALAHDLEIQRFLARLRLLALINSVQIAIHTVKCHINCERPHSQQGRRYRSGARELKTKLFHTVSIRISWAYGQAQTNILSFIIFYHSVSFLIGQVRVLISNGLRHCWSRIWQNPPMLGPLKTLFDKF